MSFASQLGYLILALSISSPSFVLSQPAPSGSAAQYSADETALRALAEAFFNTWSTKDLNGFLQLWSKQSPELEARRKSMSELFAGSEKIELRSLTIRAVKMGGDTARVRVEAGARVIEAKTGKEKTGYGKMLRTLECVKEEGNWRVRREASAFDELAAVLASAKNEQERAALCAEEKELVTVELVRALSSQGGRFFGQGDYPQALAIYSLALHIAEQIGDRLGIASALNNIGNIHQRQGNYPQALESLQKSLTSSEALGDRTMIASALNNLGEVQRLQGNYAEALEYFQSSLTIREALGDQAGIARGLNNIGIIHDSQGNYALALEYYGKSLTIAEALGDEIRIAAALNNLGLAHHHLGNYTEALQYFHKSLPMHEAIGNKAAIPGGLTNIGLVLDSQGNYALALEYYQKGLALSEALGDKSGIAKLLNNIGSIHLLQGNYAQALECYQKSLALREALGDKAGIAVSLFNLGIVDSRRENHAQALEYFQKSLAMSEALGTKASSAATLKSIGIAHRSRGNYAQALEYLQKSLTMREALGAKDGIAITLTSIASVHHLQGNYTRALEFAQRATSVARSVGAGETLWEALRDSGKAHRLLNNPVEARQALEEAIRIAETLRAQVAGGEQEQQSFFESKVFPYHAMADLLIAEGKSAEALTFAERAKARVLLDALQKGRVDISKAMSSQEQEQERKLRTEIISINTQVTRASQTEKPDQAGLGELNLLREKARLNYEAFQTSLYASHPELRVQRGEAPVITPEEIAALLPDARSALVEYLVTEEVTYLFVITKAAGRTEVDVRAYTLPVKRADLAKQTERFRGQLAGRDLGFRASARQLYQLLLKPAEAQLHDKTNLIIVPDNKLWELPFQALLAEGDRYVIKTSAVSYAPSLTVLREMKAQHNKRRAVAAGSALLALGNPALGKETIERATLALRDGKLDPLPEAEQEVKALGQLYGMLRSKVYIGTEAREDRVKAEASRARVLHFATHGILNNTAPMYSHLVLAQGDKNEDGLLEAWELMQLDLKADLAVLSACETARGRFGEGEGMIGLTWAMFVAGVPATVVSQWKVESAGTRDLMLSFHRQLRAPSTTAKATATKADALRQAALKLMKNPTTSHPFYWASFVLVGDGR